MEIWWLRHAMPSVDPDVPSSDWPLSADGLAAAAALRPLPPPGATLLASPEPKAWQTLETYAGRTCARDARLREVDRDEPFGRGSGSGVGRTSTARTTRDGSRAPRSPRACRPPWTTGSRRPGRTACSCSAPTAWR